MTRLTKAIANIALSAAVFAALGCGVQSGHGPMQDLTPQQRVQKQMEDIRNNPNMPPEAKESALATLGSHSGGSGEAPGKKKT